MDQGERSKTKQGKERTMPVAEIPAKFKNIWDGKIYKLKRICQSMILLTEQDNENHQIVTEKGNLKLFYRREDET